VLIDLAHEYGVKIICSNDSHYVNAEEADTQDLIMCKNSNKNVDDQDRIRFSKQEWLKSPEEMEAIFREAGFFPKEIMEVANCISAVQLARAGLGYTITPERAIIVLGGYDSFNCFLYGDSQDSWDVSAVYREDVYLDQAERALIGTMKQVFGKEERREET
jgi:DNA-binding transcriptional LysR family regulator